MRIPRRPRRSNAIVLTSLVDVLFVLLFFFMLVTAYGDWRSWPMVLAGAAPSPQAGRAALTVRVLRDGGLSAGGEPATLEQLTSRLSAAPGTPVLLVPEPGVALQPLVDVLDRLQPTGAALTLGRQAQAP